MYSFILYDPYSSTPDNKPKKKKKGNEEGDLRLYISVYGENVCLVKYYKYNFYLLKHTAH